jgi:hypothetical protein
VNQLTMPGAIDPWSLPSFSLGEQLPDEQGIYFVLHRSEILYIGMTNSFSPKAAPSRGGFFNGCLLGIVSGGWVCDNVQLTGKGLHVTMGRRYRKPRRPPATAGGSFLGNC